MKPGDTFGERTLVRRIEGYGRKLWLVRCSCGQEQAVRESTLARGEGRACVTCSRRRQAADRVDAREQLVERLGIFNVLEDDGEKYSVRKLLIQCSKCGTISERTYASALGTQYSKSCQRCNREHAMVRIVDALKARGPMRRRHIERVASGLPTKIHLLLNEMVELGRVVRYHTPEEGMRAWVYEAKE